MEQLFWVAYVDCLGVEQWEIWTSETLQEEISRGEVRILEISPSVL